LHLACIWQSAFRQQCALSKIGRFSIFVGVLTASVKENGTALASQAVTERYGVSANTMSKALKFLENHEVLRREELQNSMRWRLEDPFFAAWLDCQGCKVTQPKPWVISNSI
jgi:hypothetical protein